MEKQNNCNVLVVWRGMKLSVDVNLNSNAKEFGQKLQELTHVKPDTMRLFVPQTNNKGSRMLSPFSDAHSMLSLQEAAILQVRYTFLMQHKMKLLPKEICLPEICYQAEANNLLSITSPSVVYICVYI